MWSGVGETVWVANNEWRWSLKMVGLIRPSHCFTEGVTHPRPACAPALAAVSARSRRRMTGHACAVERPLSGPATPWNISCRQHIDPMPHTCLNIDISQGKKKKKKHFWLALYICARSEVVTIDCDDGFLFHGRSFIYLFIYLSLLGYVVAWLLWKVCCLRPSEGRVSQWSDSGLLSIGWKVCNHYQSAAVEAKLSGRPYQITGCNYLSSAAWQGLKEKHTESTLFSQMSISSQQMYPAEVAIYLLI